MSFIPDIRKAFIPKPILDNIQSGDHWDRFLDKWQEYYTYFWGLVMGIRRMVVPEETLYPVLLARQMGAYIDSNCDDDRSIRIKAAEAASTHKRYALFDDIIKPIIDNITGGDSFIWHGTLRTTGFIVQESYIAGADIIGWETTTAITKPKGFVYVSLGLEDAPTEDQLDMIVCQLLPLATMYYVIFLGEADTSVTDPIIVDGPGDIDGPETIGGDEPGSAAFTLYRRLN